MPLNANQLTQIISATTADTVQITIYFIKGHVADPECEKQIVLALNTLLAKKESRVLALELVNALVYRCSRDVLAENALHWMNSCTGHHAKEIKLKTTAKIIEKTADVEAFNKKFSSEFLLDTFKACLVFQNSGERTACLECLCQCMRRFPSWFGNHKQKVELFLIQCLDSSAEDVVELAAQAFHLFSQTGGAGTDGTNYINSFSSQFKQLCATVHDLYDIFFDGVSEMDNSLKIDAQGITFTKDLTLEVTARRLINCVVFLKVMIMRRFPVEKRIVPKYVIDVVRRALNVHVCVSEDKAPIQANNYSFLLNKIQLQLLKLLRVFLIGHLSSILPFSHILTKTLIHALSRTTNCSCFHGDPNYKTSIYKTLNYWLLQSKNVNHSHFLETLLPVLLKDITPVKTKALKLTVGKKRKQKSKANELDEEKTVRCEFVEENTCWSALDVLANLLRTSPLQLSVPKMKETSSFILRTIFDVQANRSVFPYDSAKCRAKLLEVLVAFYAQEHTNNAPPLHLASLLLHKEISSSSLEISKIAKGGLELLEKISQPVCNSMYVIDSKARQQDQVKNVDLMSINSDETENQNEEEEDGTKGIKIISEKTISNVSVNKLNEEEESVTKGINVISNILVRESNVVEDKTLSNLSEFDQKKEEVDQRSDEVNIETEESENGVSELTGESKRVSTEDLGEPPTKKSKEEDDSVEDMLQDMLLSFQDIPQ